VDKRTNIIADIWKGLADIPESSLKDSEEYLEGKNERTFHEFHAQDAERFRRRDRALRNFMVK